MAQALGVSAGTYPAWASVQQDTARGEYSVGLGLPLRGVVMDWSMSHSYLEASLSAWPGISPESPPNKEAITVRRVIDVGQLESTPLKFPEAVVPFAYAFLSFACTLVPSPLDLARGGGDVATAASKVLLSVRRHILILGLKTLALEDGGAGGVEGITAHGAKSLVSEIDDRDAPRFELLKCAGDGARHVRTDEEEGKWGVVNVAGDVEELDKNECDGCGKERAEDTDGTGSEHMEIEVVWKGED